ncbi:MAG: DUF3347 domain-containing protein [Deltaproteobacteria bacterium]|nr:MAG: DUF3347 domain-containing protein [Deltaproteobacteria bacterium]
MRLLALIASLLFILPACGKSEAPPEAPSTVAAPAATTLASAYEAVRLALVHDDLGATQRAAGILAKHVGADEALATATRELGIAQDLEAARLAFGEASRAYITRLSKDPALAKGKHAFRCPMAKGYKKWVQLTPELENPYMGQRMLDCGGPVEMVP